MPNYLRTYKRQTGYLLVALDILCITLCAVIVEQIGAATARESGALNALELIVVVSAREFHVMNIVRLSASILCVMLPMFYLLGLYGLPSRVGNITYSLKILFAGGLALVLGASLEGVFAHAPAPRLMQVVTLVAACIATWLVRLAIRSIRARPLKPLGVIATAPQIRELALAIGEVGDGEYRLKAVYIADAEQSAAAAVPPPGCQSFQSIDEFLTCGFSAIALNERCGALNEAQSGLLVDLKFAGVELHNIEDFFKQLTGRYPRWALTPDRVLAAGNLGAPGQMYLRAKRLVDALGALALLTLTAPIFPLLALLIKLESRGPALFVQERLGQNRKPFHCVKFRTMVQDAEADGHLRTSRDDPRVTRIGAFLRKSKLDELPQLFNVLVGDMSFVGPRPIREHFVNMWLQQVPYYDLRFNMKPGITGWAQVGYVVPPIEEDQVLKFCYDLYYLQNHSMVLDVYIVMRTLRLVFSSSAETHRVSELVNS